jgi:hypothetical protein
MKMAQKMMLISAGRTPIEYSNMSEPDQAMKNVINNRNLSSLEKFNLFSRLLQKNLKMEEKKKQTKHLFLKFHQKKLLQLFNKSLRNQSNHLVREKKKITNLSRSRRLKKKKLTKIWTYLIYLMRA